MGRNVWAEVIQRGLPKATQLLREWVEAKTGEKAPWPYGIFCLCPLLFKKGARRYIKETGSSWLFWGPKFPSGEKGLIIMAKRSSFF